MAQDGNPRRVSLVFPIILITVGALFLLHNWRPAFDPWPILTTYWPLILIFVGVGKIWDSTYRSCNPNAPQGISIGATIGALAFVIVLVALLVHGRSFTRRHGLYSGTQHNAQTVDLRDVPLTRLDLHMGAGQMDVDLTGDRKTDLTADIEGGVGQANIRLPKNVGVIAHASGGIGSINVRGLKHDGDSYINDAYGKSPATIHLKVEGGIGEITLTQEP